MSEIRKYQEKILLNTNCQQIKPPIGLKDVFFAYASIVDKNGTLVPTAELPVTFDIDGPAKLVGQNPVISEAGIASILIQSSGKRGIIKISATTNDLEISDQKIIVE